MLVWDRQDAERLMPLESSPTRTYQNHHIDSTRWSVYRPRAGDIVVCNAYKSGSTWMQQILTLLLGASHESILELRKLSFWVEALAGRGDKQAVAAALEAVPGRRVLKSHLPLDGMPTYAGVHYIVLGRDPRDVFMSLHNHYSSFTDFAYSIYNDRPDRVGPPLPRCPEDPRLFWRDWITRGWFPWERDGYPFWTNLGHVASFWPHRAAENVLFVHYASMLADLEAAVRRVANFVGIAASDALIADVVETTTFDNVKKTIAASTPTESGGPSVLRGGLDSFFFRGQNGRWRSVLTDEDLALYVEARDQILTPESAAWIEGRG